MDACNAYYYATRDPLGRRGDFTTAPEISQMFGEMVGAALADCWGACGPPGRCRLRRAGPGRGTLAADALRVMRRAGLAGEVHFVETSPVLREAQQAKRVPTRNGMKLDRRSPPRAIAARRQRIFRRAADPPVGRRRRAAGDDRRRCGLAFDRDGRDRRGFARARAAVAGEIAGSHLPRMAASR